MEVCCLFKSIFGGPCSFDHRDSTSQGSGRPAQVTLWFSRCGLNEVPTQLFGYVFNAKKRSRRSPFVLRIDHALDLVGRGIPIGVEYQKRYQSTKRCELNFQNPKEELRKCFHRLSLKELDYCSLWNRVKTMYFFTTDIMLSFLP